MSRQFAEGWLEQGAANGISAFPVGRLGLLTVAERWAPLLALADSLGALPDMDTLSTAVRLRIDAARGIAHARLGQREKALAIDSAIAALGHPRWLWGAIPLNRARIAAHVGDSARAVELLQEAMQQAVLVSAEGAGTMGSDPFLLPSSACTVSHAVEADGGRRGEMTTCRWTCSQRRFNERCS